MYRQETSKLHAMARSPGLRLVIKPHAEKRMLERDISRFEIERLLKAGVVVMIETDPGGAERWRVAGRDTDGRQIEVAVEVIPPILIVLVTVIRVG
jgi:hypothetical protein